MPKEILLYSSIYSYTASDIITSLEEAKDEDIVIRVNTPGGEVYYAYGVVAKFAEHTKGKKVKVDGRADSGGAFFCCYADDVECLDVSSFLFHRAAYPDWIENSADRFTDDMKASLNIMNAQLRAAMEGKMKDEDFKKVTGYSYDDLFSLNRRLDVVLNAKQAKKLGLVNRIITITPEKKAEIERNVMAIAAFAVPAVPVVEAPVTPTKPSNPVSQKMTLAEFKSQHPEAYSAAIAEERDRVGAYLAYIAVDPEAAVKGIKEGTTPSHTFMAEMSLKFVAKQQGITIQAESAKPVLTDEPAAPTPEAKKDEEAFMDAVYGNLGLPKV